MNQQHHHAGSWRTSRPPSADHTRPEDSAARSTGQGEHGSPSGRGGGRTRRTRGARRQRGPGGRGPASRVRPLGRLRTRPAGPAAAAGAGKPDAPDASDAAGWFTGRLPGDWFAGAPDGDRRPRRDPGRRRTAGADRRVRRRRAASAAAESGRIARFREDTRGQRIEIARQAQYRYGRDVSWGARLGDTEELFTTLSAPVMTRLRQPERQVLDTLVDSGRRPVPGGRAGLGGPSGRRARRQLAGRPAGRHGRGQPAPRAKGPDLG